MKEMMKLTHVNPCTIVNRILRGADSNVIRAVGRAEILYTMLRDYRSRLIDSTPHAYES